MHVLYACELVTCKLGPMYTDVNNVYHCFARNFVSSREILQRIVATT